MKFTTLIPLTFLFILNNQSNAQLIRTFGIKAGVTQASQEWNYSGIGSGSKIYDKARTGLDVGGYIEWFNLPLISMITEMHYMQKGAREEFIITTAENPEGTGEMWSHKPRIDYLSIPLLLKIRLKTPNITFYGVGGPKVDFLIGRDEYATGAVFSEMKSTEVGITAGAGFDFSIISSYKLGAEIRYSYSFQDAYSEPNLTVRNKSIEFLLTFGF